MGRRPCCEKEGVNRGGWSAIEDKLLTDFINLHGEGRWRSLPKRAGLNRCGKSCRLRWLNYLRPDIKRGNISDDEEELIIRLHKLLGNRWSLIAGRLPGRTDNEIKNYWNTTLSKKIIRDDDDDKIESMKSSATDVITPKLQPRCPDSSLVFPKAVKCTRVLIASPPPPPPSPSQDPTEAEHSKYVQVSDPVMDSPTMDFSMSFDEFFDTQKLSLSDNICSELNLGTSNGNDQQHSLPWSGPEVAGGVFSKEMMEGWTGNDCGFDASWLETWLGIESETINN